MRRHASCFTDVQCVLKYTYAVHTVVTSSNFTAVIDYLSAATWVLIISLIQS